MIYLMKKAALGIPALLLVIALFLFGCGKVPGVHNSTGPSVAQTTVQMATTSFVQSTRSIKVGDTLTFSDTVDGGGLHIICLGKDMVCDKAATGPSALMDPGFTINPGETKGVTFPTAGTYQITCSVHPNMNLVVTVS
jgi:plastocyanin